MVKKIPYREPIVKYTSEVFDTAMTSLNDPLNFSLHKQNSAKILNPIINQSQEFSHKAINSSLENFNRQIDDFSRFSKTNVNMAQSNAQKMAESFTKVPQEIITNSQRTLSMVTQASLQPLTDLSLKSIGSMNSERDFTIRHSPHMAFIMP